MSLIKIAEDIETGAFNDSNYNKLRAAQYLRQTDHQIDNLNDQIAELMKYKLTLEAMARTYDKHLDKAMGSDQGGVPLVRIKI